MTRSLIERSKTKRDERSRHTVAEPVEATSPTSMPRRERSRHAVPHAYGTASRDRSCGGRARQSTRVLASGRRAFAETGTVWQYLDDHIVYGIIAPPA